MDDCWQLRVVKLDPGNVHKAKEWKNNFSGERQQQEDALKHKISSGLIESNETVGNKRHAIIIVLCCQLLN